MYIHVLNTSNTLPPDLRLMLPSPTTYLSPAKNISDSQAFYRDAKLLGALPVAWGLC